MTDFIERRITMRDGLSLVVSDYRPSNAASGEPIVCLAGLTRNAKDFDGLARRFRARGRRVIALDARGRGRSDYDADWRRYTLLNEARDVVSVTDALGLHRYAVIGTSRGGLLAMVLTALRPGQMTRVVLNDIGPVIETAGLARIRHYLDAAIAPRDRAHAERIVRNAAAGFSGRTREAWSAIVDATFKETSGGLRPDFDPKLIEPLKTIDLSAPLATLWPQFDALTRRPVLAVRGANSDLLSAQTLTEMARRGRRIETLVVADAGHAPSLSEPEAEARLDAFLG